MYKVSLIVEKEDGETYTEIHGETIHQFDDEQKAIEFFNKCLGLIPNDDAEKD